MRATALSRFSSSRLFALALTCSAAVLGQIAEKKGNHRYAADLFKRASTNLEGPDAEKAAVRAGSSLSEASRPAITVKPGLAAGRTNAEAGAKTASPKQGGPYTIQV